MISHHYIQVPARISVGLLTVLTVTTQSSGNKLTRKTKTKSFSSIHTFSHHAHCFLSSFHKMLICFIDGLSQKMNLNFPKKNKNLSGYEPLLIAFNPSI
jgi:hypothetical protein